MARNCQNSVANCSAKTGITQASIRAKNTMRPPKRSVQMPRGTRIREPESTGVAASMPNSVALRPSFCWIGMPMTANIIQIMKQTANASVLANSTEYCLYFCEAMMRFLGREQCHDSAGRGAVTIRRMGGACSPEGLDGNSQKCGGSLPRLGETLVKGALHSGIACQGFVDVVTPFSGIKGVRGRHQLVQCMGMFLRVWCTQNAAFHNSS